MKTRILLVVCLLAVGFCLAPVVEAQEGTMGGLLFGVEGDPEWAGVLGTRMIKRSVRKTFLIIPVDQKDVVYMRNMLYSCMDMYPNAEIPMEFRFWMLESGMESQDSDVLSSMPVNLIPSFLLTMACEKGYRIEHVTSSHIILVKGVYEEELKEWKNRLGEEG